MRKHLLICGLCCVVWSGMTAGISYCQDQDYDDMFDNADDEFKKMKKKADDEFDRMKKSVDDQFGALLENAWREFKLARGLVRDETPKPKEPPALSKEPSEPVTQEPEQPAPIVPKPDQEVTPPAEPVPETIKTPPPSPTETVPETVETPPPPPVPAPPQKRKIPPAAPIPQNRREASSFDFYGRTVTIEYDRRWTQYKSFNTVTPSAISRFWSYYNATGFAQPISDLMTAADVMKLNDWGYCRLINMLSTAIFPDASNNRPLFVWFMLVKSGYDVRIGYTKDKIFVLIPSIQTVFQAPFYEFGGVKYYITNLGRAAEAVSSLYSYDGKNPEATKRIDFSLDTAPDIGKKPYERPLSFDYNGPKTISVELNRTMIDYLSYYPQINLDVYFRAPMSKEADESLLAGLRPFVADKSESEAVSVILGFVQKAFAYETDDEQFGEENYLFPEESLFYPYCDCEDRSFLFSQLVTQLTGCEVIGLQYPGHVATAVLFSDEMRGDAVEYNDKRYVICDPTYIGAGIGMCMPNYRGVSPVVIAPGYRSQPAGSY